MMVSETTDEGINYVAISGGSFCIFHGLHGISSPVILKFQSGSLLLYHMTSHFSGKRRFVRVCFISSSPLASFRGWTETGMHIW